MPNTLQRRSRWAFVVGMLTALAITTITLSVFTYLLRNDVGDLNANRRTVEAATCYASARGRPQLIVILRVLSGAASTTAERDIVNGFIDGYENNTPTVPECDALARMRGLDPEDFPAPQPPTQREQEREDEAP